MLCYMAKTDVIKLEDLEMGRLDRPNLITGALKRREPFWAVISGRCHYTRVSEEMAHCWL